MSWNSSKGCWTGVNLTRFWKVTHTLVEMVVMQDLQAMLPSQTQSEVAKVDLDWNLSCNQCNRCPCVDDAFCMSSLSLQCENNQVLCTRA